MRELKTDILVIGGGLGGVGAALSAARIGRSVVMTEETDWIGGQLTAQAVPMDEHPWIDRFGCTASYRRLRDGIRAYYKRAYPVTAAGMRERDFTPGAALTTRLPCEPRIALSVIEELLAPFRACGLLRVMHRISPVAVEKDEDALTSVVFRDRRTGDRIAVTADYFLDATETGELLPLAGMSYTTGAESQSATGEPHALPGDPEPLNMQAFTYCFALIQRPDVAGPIERPAEYEFWRDYRAPFETDLHLSWNPRSRPAHRYEFYPTEGSTRFSLWQFRRILYRGNFAGGFLPGEVSLINSGHNDYWLGPIIEVSEAEADRNRYMAKQLSLSTVYWLQTEAPRPDGGVGYPELQLHGDYTGTRDGLAMSPYIREGRRIDAELTVTERHVGLEALGDRTTAEAFPDSVGIGCYNIDLHPTTGGQDSLNLKTRPFRIPLRSLLPRDAENYIAAGKGLGVTHITNGCYRLHSIEWNIGESAGALAAWCLEKGLTPKSIAARPTEVGDFQRLLRKLGVELEWPRVDTGTSYYSAAREVPGWDWGTYDRRERWSI